MNAAARQLIAELQLEPLPGEGGYFRQTWRSATASAITFLITPENFSALHRLTQDEIWHFYAGDLVEHVQLDPRHGTARITRLGNAVLAGDTPQVAVSAGVWQGARIVGTGSSAHGFALLGCTVSPPWNDRGFELGRREELSALFPAHAALVRKLTRE